MILIISVIELFQPTLPVRGATRMYIDFFVEVNISTHAPRAGSDLIFQRTAMCLRRFQPTLPVRGATFFML